MINSTLLVETAANGIATVTLNNPQKHNALNAHLIKALHEGFQSLNNNPHVRVILLQANGKNFCTGADITWMQQAQNYSEAENYQDAQQFAEMLQAIYTCNKPIVALAQGMIMGGGIGLLACCDIVIAASNAAFCFSEIKLGLIPATIAPYVIKAMGIRAAQRYFLTAEKFTATTAAELGLIHLHVAEEKLAAAGLDMAKILLNNAPDALSAGKKLIQLFHPITPELIATTIQFIAERRVSPEAREGLQAFLEKRQPNWI